MAEQFNIDDAAWQERYHQSYIEQVQANTWFWNWFTVGLFGFWCLSTTIPVVWYFARAHTGWSGQLASDIENEAKKKNDKPIRE
ncbi:hypothetical protein PG996_008405 [Apiospora saccharicola]|uniref:Uncharacterized protein n=1 Tax=Apiospora saccharicola TaxID=335842 RepID=A0ABR1V128_9PEZI